MLAWSRAAGKETSSAPSASPIAPSLRDRCACHVTKAPADPCPVPYRSSCSDSGSASHAPRSTSIYPRDLWSCKCAAGQWCRSCVQPASCTVCLRRTFFSFAKAARLPETVHVGPVVVRCARAASSQQEWSACIRLMNGCLCHVDRNSRRSRCSSSWRGRPWKAPWMSTRSGSRSSESAGSSGVACVRCAALCARGSCALAGSVHHYTSCNMRRSVRHLKLLQTGPRLAEPICRCKREAGERR